MNENIFDESIEDQSNQPTYCAFDRSTIDDIDSWVTNRFTDKSLNAIARFIKWVDSENKDGVTVIAGGFVRSFFDRTPVSDIDIFVEAKSTIANMAQSDQTDFGIKFLCPQEEMITLVPFQNPSLKFQVMAVPMWKSLALTNSVTGKPEAGYVESRWQEIVDRFDIGACRAAVIPSVYKPSGADRMLELTFSEGGAHRSFFKDIKSGSISFQNIEYPAATLKRAMKYRDKGYKLNTRALYDLLYAINQGGTMPETYSEFLQLDSDHVFARYALD